MNTDARHCPNCKLINPISTLKCDCGYQFVNGRRSVVSSRARYNPSALLGVANVLCVLSYLVMLSSLIVGLLIIPTCAFMINTNFGQVAIMLYGAGILASGFISYLLLRAIEQLIRLFVRIEEHLAVMTNTNE